MPARLPTSLAAVDVRHRNAPADVLKQMEEIRPKSAKAALDPIALNLQISAPNGIFVRGRGIDAELGGDLTIGGTAVAPAVSGGFKMRRGRIVILAKRLDFTDGDITFGGGLIPVLNMEASTTSAQTTITVDVTGLANDPTITFSSSPALPQDEVLARLIFGQSMSRLSPLQIAQLADAVTQLAGGGSTSLLETLRSNLGVDDLDINTDESPEPPVVASRAAALPPPPVAPTSGSVASTAEDGTIEVSDDEIEMAEPAPSRSAPPSSAGMMRSRPPAPPSSRGMGLPSLMSPVYSVAF